jgi:hypothetical protein|tara:strand:+ start:656 stop:913 length:258 start_codon:yes stop_codon:yes gene_type:complete
MPGGNKDNYTPYKMTGHTLPGPNQRLSDPAAEAQVTNDTLNANSIGDQTQQVDSGITDNYGSEVSGQEETKVPLDVEVTVNGQPV